MNLLRDDDLVGLGGLVGQLVAAEPEVGFLQEEIGGAVLLGEVREAGDGTADGDGLLDRRVGVGLLRLHVEAEFLRILQEILGRQDAEHVAGGLRGQEQVHGMRLPLVGDALGDAVLAGVVARGHGHPVAVFLVGLLEILAGGLGRFLDVVALVDLVRDLQAVGAAGGLQELPRTGRARRAD